MSIILMGDAISALASINDRTVHCCVTSPPYWGLRDYGIEPSVWRGDRNCNLVEHCWDVKIPGSNRGGSGTPTDKNGRGENYGRDATRGQFCLQCNVWKGCLGLEPTPELYVAHLVEVFREVWRVLRDDGTLWLNLGDSYSSQGGNGTGGNLGRINRAYQQRNYRTGVVSELKPKDLVGIPWRVAFALQADGWYLRSEIIWAKPNPMPESVRDRPTKSHEHIFLLAKSVKYHYDHEAVKEPAVKGPAGSQFHTGKTGEHLLGRASSKPRTAGNKSHKYVTAYDASDTEEHRTKAGLMKIADVPWETRSLRSVWHIATKPFPEAHFATFPPKLIEPCIKAGCPAGGMVLDPFAGSGTVGMVCKALGRRYTLIEPKPEYCDMIDRRIGAKTFRVAL